MCILESFEDYCRAFQGRDTSKENLDRVILINFLRRWFIAQIDLGFEHTDYTTVDFLSNGVMINNESEDFFLKILKDTDNAFRHISQNMHEKIIRENVLMPIHQVREINGYGISWLSKKNGRSIREKLSGRSTMMAVHQRPSYDTGENRLFLAFVKRVLDIIELKRACNIGISKKEVLFEEDAIKLLHNPDVAEIRKWENLNPNNTLLSDRYYRTIWNGWKDLQSLDDLVLRDNTNLDSMLLQYIFWVIIQKARKNFFITQMPVEIDYVNFRLKPIYEIIRGYDGNHRIEFQLKNNAEGYEFLIITYNNNTYRLFVHNLMIEFEGKKFPSKLAFLNKKIDDILFSIWKYDSKKLEYSNKISKIKYNKAVIDILKLHPICSTNDGFIQKLPIRLMAQEYRNYGGHNYDISLACSNSIILDKDKNDVYTLKSVLNHAKDNRAYNLVSLLGNYLSANSLQYVFPDMYNDFQLSKLRKALRMEYRSIKGLPKSIASVFFLMQSKEFIGSYEPGDPVIVADCEDDSCSLTLLRGFEDKELLKRIPATKGIIWDRHPTLIYPLDISCKCRILDKMFLNDDNKYPKIKMSFIQKHYNGCEIFNEQDILGLYDAEDDWYTFQHKDKLLGYNSIEISNTIDAFVKERSSFIGNGKLHIIITTNELNYTGNKSCYRLDSADYLKGMLYYEELSKKFGMPLWRDHLPNLAIKFILGKFDLVSNQTIVPEWNKAIAIDIPETFILKLQKSSYHFLLVMNDGNDISKYEAVVKNKAFPLKHDVKCKLSMTYKYGDDEPYTLIFRPLDIRSAGFVEAKVEWNPLEEYRYKNSLIPDFPEPEPWSKIYKYPKLKGSGYSDLVDWIINYLHNGVSQQVDFQDLVYNEYTSNGITHYNVLRIHNGHKEIISFTSLDMDSSIKYLNSAGIIECHIKKSRNNKRYNSINLDLSWKLDRNNNWYAIDDMWIDDKIKTVIFYANQFIDYTDFNPNIQKINFAISVYNDKVKAVRIVAGLDDPVSYNATRLHKIGSDVPYNKKELANNNVLFPFHTIFANGRNINSEEFPIDLRETIKNSLPILEFAYNDVKDGDAKVTIIKILSLLSNEYYTAFYSKAIDIVLSYDGGYFVYDIGCSLQDCSIDEQKQLLKAIANMNDKVIAACTLSKAAWKNPNFIFSADRNIIFDMFDVCLDEIPKRRLDKRQRQMMLEYVLAVFRLRLLNDDEIDKYLSINNPKIRKLYEYIEKNIDRINLFGKSRLKLHVGGIEKRKNGKQKEFLYACLTYIVGEAGECDIKIIGIDESDDGID